MATFNHSRDTRHSRLSGGDHLQTDSAKAQGAPASETLARCQRRIAMLYRARAFESVARARKARQEGRQAAVRGYLDEARFWRHYAGEWARRAREEAPAFARPGLAATIRQDEPGGF